MTQSLPTKRHPLDQAGPYYETTAEWGASWTPCAYCESPSACRDNFATCWRETNTEMSE